MTTGVEWRGHFYEGFSYLRCELCHDVIGVRSGEPIDPERVVLRCYGCATTEEAEAILRGPFDD